MSKKKSKEQLLQHKQKALNDLDVYVDSLIEDSNASVNAKADKLSYWISDYARLLKKESTFNPSKYISYHRGDIVKVHLGYKIGNEEGGLHFGVVLDNNNAKSSGTLTIVPLSSLKENKKPYPNSVVLGPEIFRLVISKHDRLATEFSSRLRAVQEKMSEVKDDELDTYLLTLHKEEYDALDRECRFLVNKQKELEEIRRSILKMKNGSVALVDQITTVSKIRIYDPIYSNNVLYKIRLSDASLNLIDEKIKELFIKK